MPLAIYNSTVPFAEASRAFKNVMGVYSIKHRNLAPYVGQAEDIGERMATHLRELRERRFGKEYGHDCWRLQHAFDLAMLGNDGLGLFESSVEIECERHMLTIMENRIVKRWNKSHTEDERVLNTNKRKMGKSLVARPAKYDENTGEDLPTPVIVPAIATPESWEAAAVREEFERAQAMVSLKRFAASNPPGVSANLIISYSTHGTVDYSAQLIGPSGEIDLVRGSNVSEVTNTLIAKGAI